MKTPRDWVTRPLSQFVSLQRGFDLPTHARVPGSVPVLSSGGVNGSHNEAKVDGDNFVIGRATNIGRPTWSSVPFWPLNTTLFVKDFLGNFPKFCFYWFLATDLSGFDSGSVQPMLNRNYIANIPVAIPSFVEQRRIAGVLGALDDKIESNRKQQYVGERLLRALIERILGQFSKADSTTFDAYCTYSKESVLPENVGSGDKYIALEHMPRGSIFLNSWENAELAGIASNKNRFRQGDLLFGKLRPYFKKVGVAPVSGVCSTDILVLRPRLREFLPLITVVASSDALIDSISASATGTRMPRASWKDIGAWPVPRIPDETLIVLLQPANQLMTFLEALSFQNLKLTEMRDALLPELMSGRMRVDEAGRRVSEALDEEVADV